MHSGDVVFDALDGADHGLRVIDRIRSSRIAVARLTDAADVHEVLFARLDPELRIGAAAHTRVTDEGDRDVRVAEEADLGCIEISPFGLHWPKLDEDLSFTGILDGRYGQHQPAGNS